MADTDDRRTVRVRVTGTVQGVGFRYYTRREAAGLGLDGYVRNTADGSVEAVASATIDPERHRSYARILEELTET